MEKMIHSWYEKQSKLVIIERNDQSSGNGYNIDPYIAALK